MRNGSESTPPPSSDHDHDHDERPLGAGETVKLSNPMSEPPENEEDDETVRVHVNDPSSSKKKRRRRRRRRRRKKTTEEHNSDNEQDAANVMEGDTFSYKWKRNYYRMMKERNRFLAPSSITAQSMKRVEKLNKRLDRKAGASKYIAKESKPVKTVVKHNLSLTKNTDASSSASKKNLENQQPHDGTTEKQKPENIQQRERRIKKRKHEYPETVASSSASEQSLDLQQPDVEPQKMKNVAGAPQRNGKRAKFSNPLSTSETHVHRYLNRNPEASSSALQQSLAVQQPDNDAMKKKGRQRESEKQRFME